MSIIVVDSGSTKADWCAVTSNGERRLYAGCGVNPLHVAANNLHKILADNIPAELHNTSATHVFFYGAGCAKSPSADALQAALQQHFPNAEVEVNSDLLGAARSLFGRERGVAAVLGTGSACGLYDGEQLVRTSNSLGYIVGDEGSATDMGKRLLRAYFYHQLPDNLAQPLTAQGLTRDVMLHEVYRGARPAAYLAGFAAFLLEHKSHPFVQNIAQSSLRDFFANHVQALCSNGCAMGVVGSAAFFFSDILTDVARQFGIAQPHILRYPIARLADFHATR